MTYTEIQEKNGKKYYYRVKSIRKKGKVAKNKKYLGINLDKEDLKKAEENADKELEYLNYLLTEEEKVKLDIIKKEFLNSFKNLPLLDSANLTYVSYLVKIFGNKI